LVEVTETNVPEIFAVTPLSIIASIPATRAGTAKSVVMLEVICEGSQTGATIEVWLEFEAVRELRSIWLYWVLRYSKSTSRLTDPLLFSWTKP